MPSGNVRKTRKSGNVRNAPKSGNVRGMVHRWRIVPQKGDNADIISATNALMNLMHKANLEHARSVSRLPRVARMDAINKRRARQTLENGRAIADSMKMMILRLHSGPVETQLIATQTGPVETQPIATQPITTQTGSVETWDRLVVPTI
jgi:hypothetical protein